MYSYVHACICECMYGWVCIYYISIFCIYPYSPHTNRHPDSSGLSFRVYIFNFDINNYLMRAFVECRDARQICTHIHVLKCIVLTHWARVVCTIYCFFVKYTAHRWLHMRSAAKESYSDCDFTLLLHSLNFRFFMILMSILPSLLLALWLLYCHWSPNTNIYFNISEN